MKIGLVGATYTIDAIHFNMDPRNIFVEFVDYPAEGDNLTEVLESIQNDLDGIIFTGENLYTAARRSATATIPWTYLKRSTSSILCTLLKASMGGYDVTKITYDMPYFTAQQLLQSLSERLDVDRDSISLHRYNDMNVQSYDVYKQMNGAKVSRAEYGFLRECGYHRNNFESGRAKICLTGSRRIEKKLREEGYPAFLVQITGEDILEAVNEIRSQQKINVQQIMDDHLEAAIILTVDWKEETHFGAQEYRRIDGVCQVEKNLWSFAQSVGAAVQKESAAQYVLYSTKAELEVKTEKLKRFLVAEKLLTCAEVERVAVGIGFGETHIQAKKNAQRASKAARKQRISSWYIGNKSGQIQGPYPITTGFPAERLDAMLLDSIAAETNVGAAVLNKLLNAQRQYGFDKITTGELAELCELSVNRMNRIISKLEAAGYVAVVGSQAHSGSGRPRRLVRLLFGQE